VGILAFEMLVGRTPFEGLKENEKWAKLIKVRLCLARLPLRATWRSSPTYKNL
jgi:hypothetical protein